MVNIGVVGAGSIGRFHVREFAKVANVVAVVGSSDESARSKAIELESSFGLKVHSYGSIKVMLDSEQLDAVSICTPPGFHAQMVEQCLNSGLHVLCEKPFVIGADSYLIAKRLLKLASVKNKVLCVNTQWLSVLDNISIPRRIKQFYFYMEPFGNNRTMLEEALPHANSMLIALAGIGEENNVIVSKNSVVKVELDYSAEQKCHAVFEFRNKEERPRNFRFSINDKLFERVLGSNYEQSLVCGSKTIKIEDPLAASIQRFVSSISGGAPLVGPEEILENVRLHGAILKSFENR